MSGRGFVFLNSDLGPRLNPQSKGWNAWSSVGRMNRVLLHELGHVFGIGHVGNAHMSEAQPAYWFESKEDPSLTLIPYFARLAETIEFASWNDGVYFTKFKDNVEFESNWGFYRLSLFGHAKAKVEVRDGVSGSFQDVGYLSGDAIGESQMCNVFLPHDQTVIEDELGTRVVCSNLRSDDITYHKFVSHEGWKKDVRVDLTADHVKGFGASGDKLINLFSASRYTDGNFP